MTSLWTSKDIAAACNGSVTGDWDVDGISIDSRSVSAGDLFIALQGPRFDGHDFFVEALERGAGAAMVTHVPESAQQTVNTERLVVVGDTLEGLNALAQASRSRTDAKICAVTGSVGKTTTKEALALTLGRQGRTHATAGNLNNHWGAPLSAARMPKDSDYGVFELGMNHAGEITPLTRMVRPHVALITAVEAVHIEFFESVEGIADAKAEIFLGLEPDGTAILPADNPHYGRLAAAAQAAGAAHVVSFGTDNKAAFRLIAWSVNETGTRVAADVNGRRVVYEIGLRGKHMALNSLAVLATVDALGGNAEQAAGDLYHMVPPRGRGATSVVEMKAGTFVIIDESYNASPASVSALASTLSATRGTGRLILALGDMLELGPESAGMHAELATPLAASGIDAVFTAGPEMAHLNKALPATIETLHAEDAETLSGMIVNEINPGDVIAVKGSFGSRMSQVVDALVGLGTTHANDGKTVVNGN